MNGTVYDKLRALQEHIKKETNLDNEKDIYVMTCKLASWHYPEKRSKSMTINEQELKLYEFLINNNITHNNIFSNDYKLNYSRIFLL